VRATLSIPRRPRPTHAVAAAAGSPPDAGGSVGVQRGVAAGSGQIDRPAARQASGVARILRRRLHQNAEIL